jgi:hypothetical protein
MLTSIGENNVLDNKDVVQKFVELSRYFDPRVLVNDTSEFYKKRIVDA